MMYKDKTMISILFTDGNSVVVREKNGTLIFETDEVEIDENGEKNVYITGKESSLDMAIDDDGYLLVAYEKHMLYVTKDLKVVNYYIDISLENGLKHKMPYYTDLYLDLVPNLKDGEVLLIEKSMLTESQILSNVLKPLIEEGKVTKMNLTATKRNYKGDSYKIGDAK